MTREDQAIANVTEVFPAITSDDVPSDGFSCECVNE